MTVNDSAKLEMKIIIKASLNEVFDAWTKPELMKQWYAPGAMKVPNASSDLKVDGAYKVEMEGDECGAEGNPTVVGTYQQIIPNKLVSFTWGYQGDSSPETLVTVVLKEIEGGTEVTLTHERFANVESRDKHQHGWVDCLDNLAKLFNQ